MARDDRPRPGPRRPRGPWKHGTIPVLGLVGGIGAGKSLVAGLLADLGARVLDADAIGHALLQQRPARELVLERFGPEILDPTAPPDAAPRIDRRALGRLVFADPARLRELEAILHPRMRQTFLKAIARTGRRGEAPAVVLDAAILFEAGWDDLCDVVAYVDAPRDQRLARLAAQRGWDEATLAARERAQWPPDRKRQAADHVLTNDGDVEALRAAVRSLWGAIRAPGASRPRRPRTGAPRGR